MLPTGFAPTRHATMAHGRPVQAWQCLKSVWCCVVASVLLPARRLQCDGARLVSGLRVRGRHCAIASTRASALRVLVLTHEAATKEQWEPYLRYRLAPCEPLIMYGRSAKLEPKCKVREALYWFWMDGPRAVIAASTL